MAGMIFNLSKRGWDRSPTTMFSVLLLGSGFQLGKDFIDTIYAGWNGVMATPPFSDVDKLEPAKTTLAGWADNIGDETLGLVRTGSVLTIDPLQQHKLPDYLENNTVRVPTTGPGPDVQMDAIRIWPEQGRAGRVGSLVAIIVKGDQAAELYQVTSKPGYPIPLVAVVATGKHWYNVIARGMAQTMSNLADEYELPGTEFHKAPMQLVEPRRNVIVISDGQRTLLKGGTRAQSILSIPPGFGITSKSQVPFVEHSGDAPNSDSSKKQGGGGKLIEGAAGYRFNALRCDEDCLMRREPNSLVLPIQAPVNFCVACETAIRQDINNWQSTDFSRRPRVLIDSQLPLCDSMRWKNRTDKPTTVHTPFTFQVGTKAKWSAQVDVDPDLGLRLRNVELKDRPGDPFGAATVVFTSIGFRDLKVKFAGEPEVSLAFNTAFVNNKRPPELEELKDPTTGAGYLGGVRMRLTWDISEHYSIDAVLSAVFKDSAADFDPGGAAIGNKVYPQLAMRTLKPKGIKGKLAEVESFTGSIVLVCGNVFNTNMAVDHALHHMLTGKQQAVLAVDSNSSDEDSTFDWDKESVLGAGADCLGEDVPPWGLWGADWKAGRKLADIVDPSITPLDVFGLSNSFAHGHTGATARRGHMDANLPGLPHWSWLFDYVTSMPVGSKRFVGVYRPGETTAGGSAGGGERSLKFRWPVPADQVTQIGAISLPARAYEMTVKKLARQGAYDSVHVHPAMGHMGGHEIVPAPFCADLCIHLHVRWGLVALSGQLPNHPANVNRPLYLGWGLTGKLDRGAHTTLGGPLVPPNQRVEIAVNHQNTDSAITYTATAHTPGYRAWQVFLEQGSGVLFSYDGLDAGQIALLGGGVRAFNPEDINDKKNELTALRASNPVAADRAVRLLFHKIYERIRWYEDPLIKANVQQVPDKNGAPAALEDL